MKYLRYNNKNLVTALTGVFFCSLVSIGSATGTYPEAISGLEQLKSVLETSFPAVMGSIALVTGVVAYLLSSSEDLAPVLRVLVKIVLCCSMMASGSVLINLTVGSISTSSI